jgi:hypothetical protein
MKRIVTIVALLAVAVCGCGGASKEKSTSGGGSKKAKGNLGIVEADARCEVGQNREVLVDLNQDDSPDVRKIYAKLGDSEVLICREADLNFDGLQDIFVFFDEEGQLKRDEVDLDHDSKIDIITIYAKGRVIKQELDTNGDSMIDRVRFMDNDVPTRLEADTDGDGRVDYWEYYEGGKLIRVGMDTDGDGRADEWNRDEETEEAALAEGEEEEGGETADEDKADVEDSPY